MIYYTVIYDIMVFCNYGHPHLSTSVIAVKTLEEAQLMALKHDGEIEEVTEEIEVWPILVSKG